MKKFILFSCDNHHTWGSTEVVAVCSNLNNAIKLAKQYAKKQGNKLSEDDLYMLRYKLQTQGYSGDGELMIEFFNQNELY